MEWYPLALVLLLLSHKSSGLQWSMQCSLEPEDLTLTPAPELPGRYTVRWCSKEAGQRLVQQWRFVMFEELGEGAESCLDDVERRRVHSMLLQDIGEHLECSEVWNAWISRIAFCLLSKGHVGHLFVARS